MANFPYDKADQGALLSQQAILGGVATSTSDGYGAFRVSTIFAGTVTATTSPLSADSSRVSVVQGDAGIAHVSAFQIDAGNLHVSAFAGDAGLFRVSAIGGTAGDRTLVDGTTQTISATLTPISASPATTTAGLVVNSYAPDAGKFRVSAIGGTTGDHTIVDGTTQTISATFTPISAAPAETVAGLVTNTFQDDADELHVSAFVGNSLSATADNFRVSSLSPDAGLFRISGVGTFTTTGLSANQQISAVLLGGTANIGDVSAIVTNSLSATADNFRVSSLNQDANFMHVSGFSPDASLFRVSSFESVVAVNTGGASIFYTSTATASQVSTVKNTAGRLYGYHFGNPAGVDQYVQIFDTSGGATAGTDAPKMALYIPTLGGAVMSLGAGIAFANGIQFITTSTAAGNSVGASGVRAAFFYA